MMVCTKGSNKELSFLRYSSASRGGDDGAEPATFELVVLLFMDRTLVIIKFY